VLIGVGENRKGEHGEDAVEGEVITELRVKGKSGRSPKGITGAGGKPTLQTRKHPGRKKKKGRKEKGEGGKRKKRKEEGGGKEKS